MHRTLQIQGIGPFRIQVRRHRSFWLRDPLTHERFMFGALRRLVRPGDTVLDVGANIGFYCRFMLAQFQAGRVVAFEPMSANRRLLEVNLQLGGCADRALVLPYALSDRDGEVLLQVDDMMSASAVLDSVSGGTAAYGRRMVGLPPKTEPVQSRRLDTLIQQGTVPAPALIKVDIEGAEALMLRGAKRLLKERSPVLLVEMHGMAVSGEVLDLLDAMGYACFGYDTTGREPVYRRVRTGDLPSDPAYRIRQVAAARDEAVVREPIALYGTPS